MAWVLNRAESFLNNLDQSASDALGSAGKFDNEGTSQQGWSTPTGLSKTKPSAHIPYNLSATEIAGTANIKRSTSENALSSQKVRSNVTSKVRTPADDEKLFEFLNSPSPIGGDTNRRKKSANGKHSRQSSTSSTFSIKSSKGEATAMTSSITSQDAFADNSEDQTDLAESERDEHIPHSIEENERPPSEYDQAPPGDFDSNPHSASSLELENKLLKNEVVSLNQEMVAALARAKKAQEEMKRLKEEIKQRQSQVSNSESVVRQLQTREDDLTEELNAKNSQLAVLRVRLQEADQDIKSREQTIRELRGEKDRILRDHSDSSGVHSQALETLKSKLHDTEGKVKEQQESYRQLQNEYIEKQSQLESELKSLADSLTAAQKKCNDEKAHSSAISQQLQLAKHSSEEARQELADYKQKAARILQSKEKLIASLKEGTVNEEGSEVSSVEYTELMHERDMLKEELQQMEVKMDQLRQEIQDLEALQQSETESSQDQLRDLEDQISQMRQQIQDTEADLAKKTEQLRYSEEDYHRQKMALQSRLQEKDDEIQKLRTQLVTKTASSTSQTELENRLHALTESLIQKQTMLETLSTEKNSLNVQLERTQKQFQAIQANTGGNGVAHHHTAIHMNNQDDEEGTRQRTLPLFLRETPSDASVTRNVKRAANSIDKLSVRLGVFLRRYPVARLFVIAYMILLHLWVMIVLLTYSPEIHDSNFHPGAPAEAKDK